MAKSKREIHKVPKQEKEELNLGKTDEPKPKHKLDGRLDEIIDLILDGHTFRTIADHLRVPLTVLHRYISREEHSARAREALELSAATFADKAEQVMLDVPEKGETCQMAFQKARELAQHYRWKAAKRSPKKYGDRIDHTTGGEPIEMKPQPLIVYNTAPPLAGNENDVETK